MSISLAQRLAVDGALPRRLRDGAVARIGFLTPLTGPLAPWGKPGLDGCRIWADWVNEQGGLIVGARRQRVEIVARDAALSPEETLAAAHDLIDRAGVRIILTLGGDSIASALPWLMARRALVSTLLPFDLSPNTPSLISVAEIHPIFVVTSVEWLARRWPDLRRIAMCCQDNLLGLPSLASYRAACAVEGITVTRALRYAPDSRDAEGLVAALLESDPQILCWCSAETHMVHALTEAAYRAGFNGPILSCTGDNYRRLVERTSVDFMRNFIFSFPDFDDPALARTAFFFRQPAGFHDSYHQRFPGHWSAVSWEYAGVLDLWQYGVEIAGTTDPRRVLDAMKRGGQMMQVFGPARWYGEDLFGIDNALVGSWPVVRVIDGVARIQHFGSVLGWLEQNEARLIQELQAVGMFWQQRTALPFTPPA